MSNSLTLNSYRIPNVSNEIHILNFFRLNTSSTVFNESKISVNAIKY